MPLGGRRSELATLGLVDRAVRQAWVREVILLSAGDIYTLPPGSTPTTEIVVKYLDLGGPGSAQIKTQPGETCDEVDLSVTPIVMAAKYQSLRFLWQRTGALAGWWIVG